MPLVIIYRMDERPFLWRIDLLSWSRLNTTTLYDRTPTRRPGNPKPSGGSAANTVVSRLEPAAYYRTSSISFAT